MVVAAATTVAALGVSPGSAAAAHGPTAVSTVAGGQLASVTCTQLKATAQKLTTGKAACTEPLETAPSSDQARSWRQAVESEAGPAVDCAVGEVKLNRWESCRLEFWRYEVIQVPSGEILGTGTIASSTTTSLVRDSRTWQHRVRLGLLDATGVVRVLTTASVSLDCTTGGSIACRSTGGGSQWLTYPTRNVDFDFDVTSAGTAVYFHNPTPVVRLTNPAATEQAPPKRLDRAAQVRCDSVQGIGLGRRGGCVHPDYTPTYTLDTKDWRVDEVAWHIKWAQDNLKTAWGVQDSGPPLRRLTDSDLIDDNREAACPRSRPRPPGQTCDEYPFASTYQGAAQNSDFSWHWVAAADNSREGGFGYRSTFYRTQRILDLDPFWVKILT
jgi:hypothetical protein